MANNKAVYYILADGEDFAVVRSAERMRKACSQAELRFPEARITVEAYHGAPGSGGALKFSGTWKQGKLIKQ